ncbi:DUF4249 family protein [Sediminitomix flava]|uniref:Uncharacterized protein DUF4249 n=1 Tax=Sediminitomix flava TaxID=379075 RepID=A0A315Z981_SEDFL|nr:DUF4249 family protein [Sediminitomix flava]PWJ41950.1 uncharacterized protein DUF4249 [Sediminitomix flava]
MKKYINILSSIALFSTLTACEDIVDISVEAGDQQLVVESFINTNFEEQTVKLTYSKPFFSTDDFEVEANASVFITELETGRKLEFTDEDQDGLYTWTPATEADTLVTRLRPEGELIDRGNDYENQYQLEIDLPNGWSFESFTSIERVPKIDSIQFVTREINVANPIEQIVASFWAKDLVGVGDTYWIKAYKNGVYLNKPDEAVFAYDAAFSNFSPDQNNSTDGNTFIVPIRESINPDGSIDPEEDESEEPIPNYEVGDSVYVEIHSITETTFEYMNQALSQMENGGLFARPVENVFSNIRPKNEASQGKVVGIFCGSTISGLGRKIDTTPPIEED